MTSDGLPPRDDRPALALPSGASRLEALVFTDIVDSTGIKARASTLVYAEALQRHNALFEQAMTLCATAAVVKHTGDGFFARFPTASEAVRCMLHFQRELEREVWTVEPIFVRVGIHLGEIAVVRMADRTDIIGSPADVTARVMSLAVGGQILLSRAAADEARRFITGDSIRWTRHGRCKLKGVHDLVEIWEIAAASSKTFAPPTGTIKDASNLESPAEGHPGSSGPSPQVGPYRILQLLGEGGMGTVYKAEQREPVKRIVALKVIKPGFDSAEVIARFESERQALARMDHPNVARVLDAGTDEHERPYFVMEYVPGVPITQFADDNRLSVRQRLELFIQVCDAIAHAHTKAIIHRDIRASNVLAYMADGKPLVKVIDFGIAKALTGERLTDRTFNTELGHAIGTYESMSPEQADGSADIDIRTDVYSLGVLLYELLTGAQPFAKDTLLKATDQEIRRILREVEPPRPSTRLSGLGESATRIAGLRREQLDALAKQLRSELEWIPLKAMRKERDRRYTSAVQLAEDIENYLHGRPLLAGPESKRYRAKKWLIRHRAAVLSGAGAAVLLVAGITIYIHNIRAEQNRTQAARERAERLSDFSLSLLDLGSRPEASDPQTHLWQITESAIQRVPHEFSDDPAGKARLMDQLGVLATVLKRPDVAEGLFHQVLQERRRSFGDDHPNTLNALSNYIYVLRQLGRRADAEPLHKELFERRRRLSGEDDPDTIYALHQYGFLLMHDLDRPQEAEPLLKDALERYRRVVGPDDRDTINAINSYARVLQRLGRFNDAEPLYREALARHRRIFGPDNFNTIVSLNNYGFLLMQLNRHADAEPLFHEATDTGRRLLGDANDLTLRCWRRRIDCLKALNRNAEVTPLERELAAVESTTRPAGS